jgi:hypothetical protein
MWGEFGFGEVVESGDHAVKFSTELSAIGCFGDAVGVIA